MRIVLAIFAIFLWGSASAAGAEDGFHIDPDLPDGHYNIQLKEDGNHTVRRWSHHEKRWHRAVKRDSVITGGGTGEYTFLVDDVTGVVEDVALEMFAKQSLPLPKTEAHCNHLEYNTLNYPLIPADYWAAKQGFYQWCNLYPYVAGHISMALDGNVAVYVCQRKVTRLFDNVCSEAEFKAAEKIMNETCGDASSWVYIKDWAKEYGRMWKGEKACRIWTDFPGINTAFQPFVAEEGNGKVVIYPSGDRPAKSKEEFLEETLFEEPKVEEGRDTGRREDTRPIYGQYTGGWGKGWPYQHPSRPRNEDQRRRKR